MQDEIFYEIGTISYQVPWFWILLSTVCLFTGWVGWKKSSGNKMNLIVPIVSICLTIGMCVGSAYRMNSINNSINDSLVVEGRVINVTRFNAGEMIDLGSISFHISRQEMYCYNQLDSLMVGDTVEVTYLPNVMSAHSAEEGYCVTKIVGKQ